MSFECEELEDGATYFILQQQTTRLEMLLRKRADMEKHLNSFLQQRHFRTQCVYWRMKARAGKLRRAKLEKLVQSRFEQNQRLKYSNYVIHTHLVARSGEVDRSHGTFQRERATCRESLVKTHAGIHLELGELLRDAIHQLFAIYPLGSRYQGGNLEFTIANMKILKPNEADRSNGETQESLREYAASASLILFFVGILSTLFDVPGFHAGGFLTEKGGFCIPGYASSLSLIWMISNIKTTTTMMTTTNLNPSTECFSLWHPRLSPYLVRSFMHINPESISDKRRLFIHEESLPSEGLHILERSVFCISEAIMNKFGIQQSTDARDNEEERSIGSVLIDLLADFLRYASMDEERLSPKEKLVNIKVEKVKESLRRSMRENQEKDKVFSSTDVAGYANDYVGFLKAHTKASGIEASCSRSSSMGPSDVSSHLEPAGLMPQDYLNFVHAAEDGSPEKRIFK